MPHADMSHWQRLYRQAVFEHVSARSVAELNERAQLSRSAEHPHLFRDLPEGVDVETGVPIRDGVTAEIYRPAEREFALPVFLHIHGGGWFTGSARVERRWCMNIAKAGFVVVNIDYRLAPENPFPAGLEDCVFASRWITANIARYGGDPTRLSVGGGSAGANLAALTALVLHGDDQGLDGGELAGTPVTFRAVLLLFGVLDVHRWVSEPGYYAGDVEIMMQAYLGPNFTGKLRHPLVSPIEHPSLAELPPTYISVGAEDAFLGQCFAFAEALSGRDVPVTVSVVANADHEFHKIPEFVPNAAGENRRIIEWLAAHV